MSTKTEKSRTWKLLVYPDSAPEDWREILEEEGQRFVCILHDKDVWSKRDEKKNAEHRAGELKKAHYHGLLMFDGQTSFNTVSKICESVNAPIPQSLNGSPTTFMRYMLHLDQKDKHQYPFENLESHNGAVIDITSKEDEENLYDEIFAFLETSPIHNLYRLQIYTRKNKPDWFRYIRSHSYAIACLLTAKKDDEVEQAEIEKNKVTKTDDEVISKIAEIALRKISMMIFQNLSQQ